MKTFWQKALLGACVAAFMSISVACGGPNVAPAPTPVTITTTEPAPLPSVTTVTATPTPAPTKTVVVTPTPTAKVTPTKPPTTKPTVKPAPPKQLTLQPVKELPNGDPGGPEWPDVGATKHFAYARCNLNIRDAEELQVNGTKEVRGSQVTVRTTTKGTVITTNLRATAFVMNEAAAARMPESLWKRDTNPPTYTVLLPKATWQKAAGGKVTSITACVLSA